MPGTARLAADYTADLTDTSKSALLELALVLKRYWNGFVLVGGWAPYFILEKHKKPENEFSHVGSIDIDLAIDPAQVPEEEYASIVELIEKRGYKQRKDRLGNPVPFSFEKSFKKATISADFLTPAYPQKKTRHRKIQRDLQARTLYGAEAALKHNFETTLSGKLPENGQATASVKVADAVACIALKALALGDRYKEKDAYDIYSVLAYYENGPDDVARQFKPCLGEPVIREALEKLRVQFEKKTSYGVQWALTFMTPTEAEKERLETDIFMTANRFIQDVEK